MITVTNLTKEYVLNNGSRIKAIDDITLSLPDNGLISILGRNGSGKTTLLNIIGGIDKPTSGKVEYNHQDISHLSKSNLNYYRNNNVAFVFQDYNLIQEYSVNENIKLAIRLQQSNEKIVSEETAKAIAAVGLAGFEKRRISELSGGQRQRVVLARALVKKTGILLCDEPTGNLDEESARDFFALLSEISKKRLVIVVTHDFEYAEKYSDAIIHLKDGKINNIEKNEFLICKTTRKENNQSELKKRGSRGFSIINIFRYASRNIYSNILISIAVVLIVSICFTFLLTFYSLSHFNLYTALNNTAKANGSYMLSVTKYIDKVDSMITGGFIYGRSLETESITENDITALYEQIGSNAIIYKSYIFTEYLDYLTEKEMDFEPTDFYSNCFNEFICVDDFSTFYQELAYGKYPSSENQILIYDYMAHNMIEHGGFEKIEKIEDLLNYQMQDKFSGTTYEISGILRSNFDLYKNINSEDSEYEFEKQYLASLQCIIGYSSFFDTVRTDNYRESTYRSCFVLVDSNDEDEYNEEYISNPQSKVLKIMDDDQIKDLSFWGDFNPQQCDCGILISKGLLARILGIDSNKITKAYTKEMLCNQSLKMEMRTALVDGDISKRALYYYRSSIIGIYEGDSEEIIHYLDDGENGFVRADTEFRQFFISLGQSDEENINLIASLLPEEKDIDFYIANPDYFDSGFVLNTSYQSIVEEAVEYIDGMKKVGKTFFVVSIILVVISVIGYGNISIKKRRFEIGLFKSLGVGNFSIATIFGTEVFIIFIVAVLLSLIGSPILMRMIDSAFTDDLKFPVSFFRIYNKDLVLPILIGCGTAIIALVFPIIKLLRLQPISIIRNARK